MDYKKVYFAICIIIFISLVYAATDPFPAGSTREAYFNGVDEKGVDSQGVIWAGQSFSVQKDMILYGVSAELHRVGDPGWCNVTFRAVNASGTPTGTDLAYSNVNGSLLTDNTDGRWENYTMNSTPSFAAGNYSFYFSCPAGDGDNKLVHRGVHPGDPEAQGYINGTRISSSDSGSSFVRDPTEDTLFEIWNYTETVADETITIVIDLEHPPDDDSFTSAVMNFTANYTITNGEVTNATYYIWDSDGAVFNISLNLSIIGASNRTVHNITGFSAGSAYEWNVLACAENSTNYLCDFAASNFSFTSSAFTLINVTYNRSAYETSYQQFSINISANPSISSASATFRYNETAYIADATDTGSGYYVIDEAIDIPIVNNNSENKTFFFEWAFVLTTGETIYQNTSVYHQEVNRTYFSLCNSTHNTQFVNFTTYNAINPFPELNTTFKSTWFWWLGTGTQTNNMSYENISETLSTFDFCADPNRTYTVNSQIEIDGSGYAQNYHYLDQATINQTTTAIDLYLLNDSKATLTVLEVRDAAQNPLENVTIQIQLYDVGTDTFYTVAMAKTAFNGEDLVYLNWYDSLYKFVLTQDGEVIKQTNPYKISETPQIFEIVTDVIFNYDKFNDIVYTLIYNNATENFVLTFTMPTGGIASGCLRVIKRTVSNDTEICDVCETSSSATLYCNIADYGNGTFIGAFYATGSLAVIDWIQVFVGAVNEIYDLIGNIDGTLYAFFFALIVVAMFFVTPVLGVIGLILGMLGAMVLGFQPLNYLEFIGVIMLGGFVIWMLKR